MEQQTQIKPLFLFILFLLLQVSGCFSATTDSLRFEVLLTSKMAREKNIDQKLISSFEITPKNLILFSTNNQFYMLGWGGINPVGNNIAGVINSFAFTSDTMLMVVRNKELCAFTRPGELSSIFKLPNEGMGISTGKHVMYLYDRKPGLKRNALYLLARGKKYDKLFELATPFNSVLECDNLLIFSTQNGVFQYNEKNDLLKAIAVLPEGSEVRSVAVDTATKRIYFSSQNSIYSVKDTSVLLLTDKFSGILKYFNGGLIVLNPDEHYVIRIVGLEAKIRMGIPPPPPPVVKPQPKTETLTNASVVTMVQSQLSEEMIINIINKSQVNFNMSVDSMIYLSNQNVSSGIIRAMKSAMKKKTEGIPDENNK